MTVMATMDDQLTLIRLLQLVSPNQPTGAFAYSQGLEWGIEAGWITDGTSLADWLTDLLETAMARVDLPLLVRMQAACGRRDKEGLASWCDLLLACRETDELRREEGNRGRALLSLLQALDTGCAMHWPRLLASCQLAGFACAADHWDITPCQAATGYAWSWLENQVLAGVKIIPLGQSQGQSLLLELGALLPGLVQRATALSDQEIGAACQGLAIASSRHETQYTRLYRS